MARTKLILIAFYALAAIAGLFLIATSGGNIFQLIFVVLSFVTILALSEHAGAWARIAALLFGGFILLGTLAMMVMSLGRLFSNSSIGLIPMIAAPIIAVLAAFTIRALLDPARPAS